MQNIDDCLNDLHTILSNNTSVVSCYKVNNSLEEINNRRRLRYMDLFTLYNLQSRKKSIAQPKSGDPNDIFTRIIACLYYGYSTNIACYSGIGKDYVVKFSKIKGSPISSLFKTSTFDYKFPDTPPNILIYNYLKSFMIFTNLINIKFR